MLGNCVTGTFLPDRDPAVVDQTLQTMVAPLEVLAGLLTVTLLVLNANIAMMSQCQQAPDQMQQPRKAQTLYLLLELHNWLVQFLTHTEASELGGSCPGAAPETDFVCSCTVCIMACTASDQFLNTLA